MLKTYAELTLPQFAGDDNDTVALRKWLGEARAAGPLAKNSTGPIVLRYSTVKELLHDIRLRGVDMDLARLSGIPEGSRLWRFVQNSLLFTAGEDHRRLRRLVAKAFTPRAVETLRPYTRSVMRGLIDAVFDAGHCDAVASLTDPFPIPVVCALVGVAPDRIDDIRRWATSIVLFERSDAHAHLAEINHALAELDEHIDALIVTRRKTPRDDLLSRLIAVEEAGDRLSSAELQDVVAAMIVAGTDTTRNQLALLIHTFTEFPNDWDLLRARPDLVLNAVEEAIRWQPATVAVARVALEDIALDDTLIPAGSIVWLCSWSANLDETALAGADRFDFRRAATSGWQLSTFGGGIHYCLGANLARVELREALAELSSRFAELRPNGEPIPNPVGSSFKGYRRLPIAWR